MRDNARNSNAASCSLSKSRRVDSKERSTLNITNQGNALNIDCLAVKEFTGSINDIEEIATRLLEYFKSKINVVTSQYHFLCEIVNKLKGSIVVSNNPFFYEEDGGSLLIKKDKSFIITLSPITSPLRDNFTIAHELGHYFLHYDQDIDIKEDIVFARYGRDLYERQANCFAASFLMPKDDFIKAKKEYGNDYSALATRFEVSETTVRIRERNINSFLP